MNELSDKPRNDATQFERFFSSVSYAAVFCGFSALCASGSIGFIVTALFLTAVVAAWLLEGSRWQIGEKLGTALIVLALPVFYGIWQLSPAGDGMWIAGLLARMILCLTAVKLLQRKSDRDWIFLYLMAFFEVLLAAGLSISALYLINFLVYLLLMACAVIAFEIRKTARSVGREARAIQRGHPDADLGLRYFRVRRIPASAVTIIAITVLLAIPLFFILPRVGGAGLGNAQSGLPMSGFSDNVTLGNFGRITEDDRIVMRVKFDDFAAITNNLYFRGMAFDTFDNKSWSRSRRGFDVVKKRTLRGEIEVGEPRAGENPVGQTIILDPINTPVLFALTRPVGVGGVNMEGIGVDAAGAIERNRPSERIVYRAVSDANPPPSDELQRDRAPYSAKYDAYLSLPPDLDPRFAELAEEIGRSKSSRYDKARETEYYLQTSFRYTLEQKATGDEPLADFLFNVQEGHCEYFASAMAILLRTQGIATRVVNGFHGGDYNETAGMTIVRQRHAHAWVEVYFPGVGTWLTFDPTPVGNQPGDAGPGAGVMGAFSRYAEALESIWIEYFVAFDESGQRGLRASAANEFSKFQSAFGGVVDAAQLLTEEWMAKAKGSNGAAGVAPSIAYLVAGLIGIAALGYALYWTARRMLSLTLFRRLRSRLSRAHSPRSVEFYEQLVTLLAARGLLRSVNQTPLEFALATNLPEALTITRVYQQVRFGDKELSASENQEMAELIQRLKGQR